MSAFRAAAVLAVWGAGYRDGVISADDVTARLAAEAPAGVRAVDPDVAAATGLPGPGSSSASVTALLPLLREAGHPGLVLPVAGDIRGLAVGSPALVPALDAGAVTVLPRTRLPSPGSAAPPVPGCPDAELVLVPTGGQFRVYRQQPAPQPMAADLFDADRDLDDAVRFATRELVRLNVARDSTGGRERIAAEMLAARVVLPPLRTPAQRHASELLAKASSLVALLRVAADHETAAVSRYELGMLDESLRPLAGAARAAQLAAIAALTDGVTDAAPRPGTDHSRRDAPIADHLGP